MNIRYSKNLRIPRKIVKYILSAIYPVVIKVWPLPKVNSIEETLDKVIKSQCSISRFGDGEFLYIIDKINLPFQEQNADLRQRLIEILASDDKSILVGLPIGYYSLKNLKRGTRLTWRSQISWIYPRLYKYLKKNKIYYNASMTRLYMDYEDTSKSDELFSKIRLIWDKREVILIEGEKSRLGVGNDLFANVKSLHRIIGPYHHGFNQYENLLNQARSVSKDKLILVSMGPTAKPLVFNLAKEGYQAIDIGNIDIEYEWFLRSATSKIKIPGKYTSEAIGGRKVDDLNCTIYQKQIIAKFL